MGAGELLLSPSRPPGSVLRDARAPGGCLTFTNTSRCEHTLPERKPSKETNSGTPSVGLARKSRDGSEFGAEGSVNRLKRC